MTLYRVRLLVNVNLIISGIASDGAGSKQQNFALIPINGVTLPRMATKKTKSHTSARKKALAASTSRHTKKAASKSSKRAAKSKACQKKADELKRQKKLEEITLKMFQTVYDDYQEGKFHLLFR